MKNNIRQKLDNIPDTKEVESFNNQLELVSEIDSQIKHSDICDCKYNPNQMCFSYALGIPDEVMKDNKFYFKPFVKFLVDEKVLIPSEKGDIVLYGGYPLFEHAGIRKNNKVISKWGFGHVFEHGILSVPSSYSDHYGFYDIKKSKDMISLLNQYKSKCL